MYCLDERKECPVCNWPHGNYKGCNPVKVAEKTDEQEKQEKESAWKMLEEIKSNKSSNSL